VPYLNIVAICTYTCRSCLPYQNRIALFLPTKTTLMHVLFTILKVIIVLVAVILLIALFIPKRFSMQKEVVINKPKQAVFDYLKLIKNQEQYSVWVMKDPNIKIVYTGTDGTTGFVSAWESNDKNVGVGEQEIKKITEGESTLVEIRFKKPFEGTNQALTTVTAVSPAQTKVVSQFSGTSKYPINVMNLFMDKLVGGDMQQNLLNMKTNLEK
jgi:competence protein ComGC